MLPLVWAHAPVIIETKRAGSIFYGLFSMSVTMSVIKTVQVLITRLLQMSSHRTCQSYRSPGVQAFPTPTAGAAPTATTTPTAVAADLTGIAQPARTSRETSSLVIFTEIA